MYHVACCLLGGSKPSPGTTNNANGGSGNGGSNNGNTGVSNSGALAAGVLVNTGANGNNGNRGIGGSAGMVALHCVSWQSHCLHACMVA